MTDSQEDDPRPPTYDQIVELDRKLDQTIRLVEETLVPSAVESSRRSKIAKWISVAGICVGVVGLGTAYYAREASISNDRAINDIEATRAESRSVTCDNHNAILDAIELKVIRAASGAILALVPGASTPDDLDPETRAKYDSYVRALEADQSLAPLRRDCSSKAAIDAYYEGSGPGSTPAVTSPPSTNRQEIP